MDESLWKPQTCFNNKTVIIPISQDLKYLKILIANIKNHELKLPIYWLYSVMFLMCSKQLYFIIIYTVCSQYKIQYHFITFGRPL
jgi:hypothetical protein